MVLVVVFVASTIMTGAQVSAAVRISPVIFNSTTELQPLLEQLSEVAEQSPVTVEQSSSDSRRYLTMVIFRKKPPLVVEPEVSLRPASMLQKWGLGLGGRFEVRGTK